MRNPRFSKTEGKKNAAAENRIIQRMKNLVMRSFSEVKAPSMEFNLFVTVRPPGCRREIAVGFYRFGSTPIAIFENPWVFARSMVLTTGPCMASESALIITRVSLLGIF